MVGTLASDLVIRGATVLANAVDAPKADCDVVVVDGHFVAIGPDAAKGRSARLELDGSDLVVTPGLCNAHTHSPETLARGRADGMDFDGWVRAVWSDLDRLDADALEMAVLLAAIEMLHGGVTTVVDHFRQTPMRDEAVDIAAGAWLASGLRVAMALMVRDRAVPDWVTEREDAVAQIDRVRRCHARWNGRGDRLRIAFGPSAPTRCSDELLTAADMLWKEHGIATQMHVDETRRDVEIARSVFATTAVAHLDELGLLGPHLSLAHCVWCNDEDLDRIAASGAAVVHNPVANLRLGSGRAPVERMRDRGIRLMIGTDGAASNDSQNLREAVKMAALLPRIASENADHWIPANEALAMATQIPAGMAVQSKATIAPGARADFAAFSRSDPLLTPGGDPVAQIVLAGGGLRARHVAVDGVLVVREHMVQTIDETAVRAWALDRSPSGSGWVTVNRSNG